MSTRFRLLSTAAVVAAVAAFLAPPAAAEKKAESAKKTDPLKNLKYRLVGPAAGGRCSRAAGVPGDPLTYYAGTANGGVWKSIDGGVSWKPIFDDQPIASVGSLAIAPSDPNVIYVGSGEANIRGDVAPGNGIYKSTDAGKTWKQVWKQEGQIGTMIVHPTNPDIAYAAVLGHVFGPNEERGVYRTTDGGKNWQRVLYKNRDTGASDVCFDPANPKILFAGLWQARRYPWDMNSGGPGSGLYMSRDGGDSWKHLTGNGLPEGVMGKIGVAVAGSDSRRVYALIEADKGGLFRSDDGGDKWQLVSTDRNLRQRSFYYTTITVDPKNSNVVWCPQVQTLRSIDGGRTFRPVRGMHHGDNHDIWIDPTNPRRMINSNDGGLNVTTNGGESWYSPHLPISQFYHVAADNHVPYHISGCMQDLGTACGPSDNLGFGGIGLDEWHSVGGGEAGWTAPDPHNPDIVYAGEYGGVITRYDHKTRTAHNMSVYPRVQVGHGGEDLRYRFQWTAPIFCPENEPNVVYHGGNVLFRSNDGGMTWEKISDDLTRNDKSKQKWAGGPITGDNTGVEIYDTIFVINESPKQKGLLWVGSDDGLVHISRDAGKSWQDVTSKISGSPEWGTISSIEPSPFDAGTAYVVVDGHRLDDMKPYVYKTTDFGETWTNLGGKLSQDVYLHAVREDPTRKGLLYLATERGVMYSPDDGENWHSLKLNMPTAAVHDLVVKNNDLVVGTHGRSLWILDDLAPLRELSSAVAEETAHLFTVPAVTRWHYGMRSRGGEAQGENAPHGAIVTYYLKSKPKGPVTLQFLDERGKEINKLTSKPDKDQEEIPEYLAMMGFGRPQVTAEAGMNRTTWNLRYKGPTTVKKSVTFGGNLSEGPLVLPGHYTVKLSVDGKDYTANFTVQPDPRLPADATRMEENLKWTLKVREDLTRLANAINQIKGVKSQLVGKKELLKEKEHEALTKAIQEMIDKLDALEAKMHNSKAEITYDLLAQKGGAKLYSALAEIYGTIMDTDAPPTQGVREVYDDCMKELQGHETELKDLLGPQLAKINEMAKDIPFVSVPKIPHADKKAETGTSGKK